jgi:hypothetical protein
MRLMLLLVTAILAAPPLALARQEASSPRQPSASTTQDGSQGPAPQFDLPVSLDKIKEGLQQTPTLSLRTLDERPTFRVQILERQKIQELLATLDFKAGPTPAGGIYWNEVQRQMWPSVANPLNQPYAAFNQGELLTILIENLVGKYLAGKAVNAITAAERSRAEAAAKEEVQQAIRDYCTAQPGGGAGIQICSTSPAIR